MKSRNTAPLPEAANRSAWAPTSAPTPGGDHQGRWHKNPIRR
jgi:hypothetical protein